jgi:hypothetical protein
MRQQASSPFEQTPPCQQAQDGSFPLKVSGRIYTFEYSSIYIYTLYMQNRCPGLDQRLKPSRILCRSEVIFTCAIYGP